MGVHTSLQGLAWVGLSLLFSGCLHTQIPRAEQFAAHLPGLRADASHLSDKIGKRVAGEVGERKAAEFIAQRFRELGLADVEIQDFAFPGRMGPLPSANVIARLPGRAPDAGVVVIGAHYDSVAEKAGRGASDNAVSVAVLLVLADMFTDLEREHELVFVAFGAEEPGPAGLDTPPPGAHGPGLYGSRYFVEHLAEAERGRVELMVNLDSIVGGDHLYVYAAEGPRGWPRDKALKIARRLGIEFRTNPGLHPDYPEGTSGPWSDHAAFDAHAIPYAYFEATNWEIGDLDGYAQTEAVGQIWHSDNDTLDYLDQTYPGRIDRQAVDALRVIYGLLR